MRRIAPWLCLLAFVIIPCFAYAQSSGIDPATQINSVAWSPDGTRIAASFGDSAVKVWNFSGNTELGAPSLTFRPDFGDRIQWTPDSQSLIAEGRSGFQVHPLRAQVTKWDAGTGKLLQTLFDYRLDTAVNFGQYNTDEIPIIAFDNTFTRLAFSMQSRSVALSDAWPIITVSVGGGEVTNLSWSPNNRRLAVVCAYTIQTFDIESTELIDIIEGPADSVYDMQWSADSSQLAVLWAHARDVTEDISVMIYTISPDNDYRIELPDKIFGFNDTFSASLAWRPHSNALALASPDVIQYYDLPSGKQNVTLPTYIVSEQGATAVAWSPDGKYLAGGLMHGTVHIWSVL